MQLTVRATLTCHNQKLQKDLPVLLSDTPLTILLEMLKQAKLMQPAQNFTVEPNRQGLRLGETVWQVLHGGKALDLLQSMLLLPEARQAGTAGLAVEVVSVADECAALRSEIAQLRQAAQQWDKNAQASAATIKRLEEEIAAALSRAEALEKRLHAAAGEREAERRKHEQQIAGLGAPARASEKSQALQRQGVILKNPPPTSALEQLGRSQQQWEADRQKLERTITQQQEKITHLEQALHDSNTGANAPLTSDEVTEIEKQLQRKQEELEAEAQRLKEQRDELDAMEEEFRSMEVKTARERAEMNRQKAEFQRLQRQFDFILSQATKKPDIEKAMAPVILLREQIRKTTGM